MNEFEIVKAIKHLKPNAEFSFEGTDYSTIKWHVLDGEAPTESEIDAALVKIEDEEIKAAAKAKADKAALLNKLGITAEEAALLLS